VTGSDIGQKTGSDVSHAEQTKHSFFVEAIVYWNELPDKVVCADSIEVFKTALQEYSP
jgi:hypothetical protein